MGARAPTQFVLTPKGIDELSQRTYRLDARVRNILFLIQKGTPTVEGILENTIFPQDEVVQRLQTLLKDEFVALGGRETAPPRADPAPAPAPSVQVRLPVADPAQPPASALAVPVAATLERATSEYPQLDRRVSVSQARFVLSDFCLDLFGTKGQSLIEQIDAATDLDALQKVLEQLTREVRKHRRSQMSALLARVREINELRASAEPSPGALARG